MKNKFFGSKLNTVLLIILIILVIVAIFFIYKSKNTDVIIDKPMLPMEGQKGQMIGNKDDLVAFSIMPNTKVHGIVSYRGVIKGGYFFEGNILVGVANLNKKIILQSNAIAKDDWMTTGPVNFEGNIDFAKVPKGPAYIEIHNDNASGLPENDKSILIPIIIE